MLFFFLTNCFTLFFPHSPSIPSSLHFSPLFVVHVVALCILYVFSFQDGFTKIVHLSPIASQALLGILLFALILSHAVSPITARIKHIHALLLFRLSFTKCLFVYLFVLPFFFPFLFLKKKTAKDCAVDGANYAGTYGITTSGSSLSLQLVTGANVGSRVYLMEDDSNYQVRYAVPALLAALAVIICYAKVLCVCCFVVSV